jgi:hypothetical protein
MKSMSLEIKSPFYSGLRSYHKRSHFFQNYDLMNIRPTKLGLTSFTPVTFPIPQGALSAFGLTDEVFPFPQLLCGKKYNFVCGVNRIFIVDPNDWSLLLEVTTYDPNNPDDEKDISPGGIWELADFWDTWFLTNGVCTVFSCGVDWLNSVTQKVYVSDTTPINTALDFKGRLMLGGFDKTRFWSDTADTFLSDWYKKEYDTGFNPYLRVEGSDIISPLNESFVWWSSIGGGDALLFFFPSKVLEDGFLTSSYGEAKPFWFDLLKRNEQGFAPMSSQGQVLALRQVGDLVIAFSERGTTALRFASSPSPTFSLLQLQSGGLAGRGAVASNDKICVFVDNSGMLCYITNELEEGSFGYREFFYNFLGTDINISHSANPEGSTGTFGSFYISNSEETFVLNSNGLFKIGQVLTSVNYKDGATVGLGEDFYDEDARVGRVGIEVGDFNIPGVKMINWFRLNVDELSFDTTPLSDIEVSIDYLYNIAGDGLWHSTSYKKLNKEGVVFFPVCGIKFRINIKVDNYEHIDFISAEVGITHGDKRFTRGIQVPEAGARTDIE